MILIDGYNLMHVAGLMRARFGPGGLEKARRSLIGVLAGSLGTESDIATIVFDARTGLAESQSVHESRATRDIRVEFATGSGGADERIEQLIQLHSAPKRLTVVSSDARIRTAAQRRGARAVDSETYWRQTVERRLRSNRQLASNSEKPAGRLSRDNESWLKEFEGLISDDDLRELAGPFSEES